MSLLARKTTLISIVTDLETLQVEALFSQEMATLLLVVWTDVSTFKVQQRAAPSTLGSSSGPATTISHLGDFTSTGLFTGLPASTLASLWFLLLLEPEQDCLLGPSDSPC